MMMMMMMITYSAKQSGWSRNCGMQKVKSCQSSAGAWAPAQNLQISMMRIRGKCKLIPSKYTCSTHKHTDTEKENVMQRSTGKIIMPSTSSEKVNTGEKLSFTHKRQNELRLFRFFFCCCRQHQYLASSAVCRVLSVVCVSGLQKQDKRMANGGMSMSR